MSSQYFAGIDLGSTMTKVVIMNRAIVASVIGPTGPEHRKLANKVMEEALAKANLPFDGITYVVATGYGRINVPFADKQITEISCHARGVGWLLPEVRTVIDIGGQFTRMFKLDDRGRATAFLLSEKCAAGSGRFLQVVARVLQIDLEDIGELSLKSQSRVDFNTGCATLYHWVLNSLSAKF